MKANNLWHVTGSKPPKASDVRQLEGYYDLVIIGAGIAGCCAALTARELGKSVALFEADLIGGGAAGSSVGLVHANLSMAPEDMEARLGNREGSWLYNSLSAGPDRVFSLVNKYKFDCEATRKGTLHCAHTPEAFDALKRRARQFRDRGVPVEIFDKHMTAHRTGTTLYHGALYDPRAGSLQPMSYCRGLAHAALLSGAQLFEKSRVTLVTKLGSGWRLNLSAKSVKAGKLLVTSQAELPGLSGLTRSRLAKDRSFLVATRPLEKSWQRSVLINREAGWDTTGTSFRLDKAGRLIFGGVGSIGGLGRFAHLAWARRKLAEMFPHLAREELHHIWGSSMCRTKDALPKILEIGEGGYAMFGFGGRGVAAGTILGTAAAKALITENARALPVTPVSGYGDAFSSFKASVREANAIWTHMRDARP